jgi:CRP-like cAMP-binding protein
VEFEEVVQLKRNVPFLSDLTVEEIQDLLRVARVRIYRESQVLFKEGEAADGMYVLLKGDAKVEKRLQQGDQLVLSKLKAGDVVGEMGLLEYEPRSATVRAVTPCTTLFLESAAFDEMRRRYHPAAMKVLKRLCAILAARASRLEEIITDFYDKPERSLDFMEKRYLKFVGHPGLES